MCFVAHLLNEQKERMIGSFQQVHSEWNLNDEEICSWLPNEGREKEEEISQGFFYTQICIYLKKIIKSIFKKFEKVFTPWESCNKAQKQQQR
jgi:hypothetical protein